MYGNIGPNIIILMLFHHSYSIQRAGEAQILPMYHYRTSLSLFLWRNPSSSDSGGLSMDLLAMKKGSNVCTMQTRVHLIHKPTARLLTPPVGGFIWPSI